LIDKVLVTALAKQNEELFVHGRHTGILLPRDSQGLYLLQRIRDEAHRFALSAHRKRRTKQGLASRLDAVPGIGPAKRKSLLAQFGSIKKIEQASIEELATANGISEQLAFTIKDHLN